MQIVAEFFAHCVIITTRTAALGDSEQRRWNNLQNTPTDIRLLTDHRVRHVRD